MDAYDIFKKLTRGAKFKTKDDSKHLRSREGTVQKRDHSSDNKSSEEKCFPPIAIKKEKPDIDECGSDDGAITLLGSIRSNDMGKKPKKRKATETIHDFEKKRKLLEQEKINQYRNQNNISVVGRHIPEPAKTFEEYGVDDDIMESLIACGYKNPTAIQKQAVPIMLQGRQILACAPTGSGKTAAFLVPIIQALKKPKTKGVRALIICPTRELAKQTQRECVRLVGSRDLRVETISKIKNDAVQCGIKGSKKFDILITTPNRICFLLKQDPPALSLQKVEWLVIDEADKLFETGVRSFREQLQQILQACTCEKRKIAMFSATYTPAVAKWCVHNMKGLIRVTVGQRNAATDLVDQELLFVGNESGKLLAFRDLVRKGLTPPVLVFVQSKERAQQLFNELIYDGINVDAIHADRTQLQRDNTVRSFREGHIWVLICTELMARGIDFKGVNLVINYDFPPSAIAYVHRVGRAGRAGRRGRAITFFTTEDTVNLRSIAHVLKQSGCDVPEYMLTMKKRPKKERKKLESSAPPRNDITTKPIYEILKKKRQLRRAKGRSNQGVEATVDGSRPVKKLKKRKIGATKEPDVPKKKKRKTAKKLKNAT